MRRLALPFLIVLALPAPAGGTKDDYIATRSNGSVSAAVRPAVSDTGADPVQRFVDANITETLYHELGHVLIDVLDLPVFGPEEFAVDMFAIVMMNRMHDEAELVQMTYDVAAAYDAGALKERTAGAAPAMWDLHGSDRQRYFNLACLMYGANPAERGEIVTELGLPEERMKTCEEEYALTARAWGDVLNEVAEGAPGDTFRMDWIYDATSPVTRHVTAEVDRLNAAIVLPVDITVSVIPCGEINAFYDPGPREMIICTEMADHLAELAQ